MNGNREPETGNRRDNLTAFPLRFYRFYPAMYSCNFRAGQIFVHGCAVFGESGKSSSKSRHPVPRAPQSPPSVIRSVTSFSIFAVRHPLRRSLSRFSPSVIQSGTFIGFNFHRPVSRHRPRHRALPLYGAAPERSQRQAGFRSSRYAYSRR